MKSLFTHSPSDTDGEPAILAEPGIRGENDLALLAVRVGNLLQQDRLGVEQVLGLNTEFDIRIHLVMRARVEEAGALLPDGKPDAAIDRSDEIFRAPVVGHAQREREILSLVKADEIERVFRHPLKGVRIKVGPDI